MFVGRRAALSSGLLEITFLGEVYQPLLFYQANNLAGQNQQWLVHLSAVAFTSKTMLVGY